MKTLTRWLLLALAVVGCSTGLCAADPAPLRVAVSGLVHGHVDGFFARHAVQGDVEIVGISDPDRSLFERYAAKFHLAASLYHSDLDEMLHSTRPQAVLIYSDTSAHRRIVEICAKHHVSVMMEKPLATSVADARAIARAAETGKIQVLVNYETSWYPSNHVAYRLLHSGAIGAVRKVVIEDGHEGPKEIGVGPEFLRWLTDPERNGGGALFDFGCYGADLMTWLMDGQRPLRVTAVTQQIKPDIYPRVEDEATIVLTYPTAQAIIQASWNWPFSRKDMEVYGRTGYVITLASDEVRVREAGEKQDHTAKASRIPPPYDDPLAYLRAVLLDGAKPDGLSSLETNILVTEILDAARQSAASGKSVPLQ